MKEILKLNSLYKDYGIKGFKTKVLNNISLIVTEGEFISIMGPSGAGKTTLLNLLSTLDKPTRGEILLDGVDIVKLKNKELSKVRKDNIGFIFQDYNLLDNMNLMDNIALPLALGRAISKEVSLFYILPLGVGLIHGFFAIKVLGDFLSEDLFGTFILSTIVCIGIFMLSCIISIRSFKKIVNVSEIK